MDRPIAVVLAEAASAAGFAPSIHNTQPWRWIVRPDALDLYADRSRQLLATDPEARLLLISCGAALHHARVALAAEGYRARIQLLPEGGLDHLARITIAEHIDVSATAMRLFQASLVRHTDRRPVSDTPVPAEALAAITEAAGAEGVGVHVLGPDQVLDLAAASSRAYETENQDPGYREELARWTGGARTDGTGVPDATIPLMPPLTTVPGRDFGHEGALPVTEGHDKAAVYGVLYGAEDEPRDWLRAGQALSAVWLTATELGVGLLPFSAVVELPTSRQLIRHLLAGLGSPYLVVRLGIADPNHAGPPHTPRLPTEQVIEVVEGTG